MSSTVYWLITDTHFNHEKMCEYENRPADFNEQIIANWQKLVGSEDTVIHLGDVILGQNGTLDTILRDLPGRKILTLGNHDHGSVDWYMRKGFDKVVKEYRLYHNGLQLLFSHEPVMPLPNNIDLNIHGHFHRNPARFNEVGRSEYYSNHSDKYRLI